MMAGRYHRLPTSPTPTSPTRAPTLPPRLRPPPIDPPPPRTQMTGATGTPALAPASPCLPLPQPLPHSQPTGRRKRGLGRQGQVCAAVLALALLGLVSLVFMGRQGRSWEEQRYLPEWYNHRAEGIPPFAGGMPARVPVPDGQYYRDPTPGATALHFWSLAEAEMRVLGVDSCGDKYGRALVDAYAANKMVYCGAELNVTLQQDNENTTAPGIVCMPLHDTHMWPVRAAPCVSRNLHAARLRQRQGRGYGGMCVLSPAGEELQRHMRDAGERFLGSEFEMGASSRCADGKRVTSGRGRTMLVVPRQDQWNPFHVAEDLLTTLVTLFVAAAASPGLEHHRLQLVFPDTFGIEGNHFTPLYERMGAWAPRRLSLDPWDEGECLSTVIHSVGAGVSLLSAMGVGTSNTCASSITWAAAHYYRHLFGIAPKPLAQLSARSDDRSNDRPRSNSDADSDSEHNATSGSNTPPTPDPTAPDPNLTNLTPHKTINVLYLTRTKWEKHAKAHGQWDAWRSYRHLENDAELVDRLRAGLAAMCDGAKSVCEFVDDDEDPAAWAQAQSGAFPPSFAPTSTPTSSSSTSTASTSTPSTPTPPTSIRFAAIDPSVHALETQIQYVAHTSVLLAQHGGALGLSLFLPPAHAAVLEMQVPGVSGNYHFEHLAAQTGQRYECVRIAQRVGVEAVWGVVERHVRAFLE